MPPMTNVIEIRPEANESEGRRTLDALCLEGARQMQYTRPGLFRARGAKPVREGHR
jgi:hypothetical protein